MQPPGVILADALFINDGATATNANAAVANNAIVVVLFCIDTSIFPYIGKYRLIAPNHHYRRPDIC